MNATSSCPECGKPLPAGSDVCPACLMAQAIASRTLDDANGPREIPPPLSPEEIAEKFPQFEILECLGRGGMGVVYKARQKSLNRLVAIKILAPERERDTRFAERFAKEAEMLAKLSHPHIVTIHDFGESGGLYFLVMEFINGVNLRDLLREGKMSPEQALAIVPPICDALQFAHDHGIVHRDIKPENILLDRDGRVKIADFGIATLAGDAVERAGTPHYMAPEQSGGASNIDHRADVYALGVVLYEMLTGERPTTIPVAPSRRVQIDVRLDEVVLRALEAQPERRFQTVGEFQTILTQAVHPVAAPLQDRGKDKVTKLEGWRLLLHFSPAILLVAAWWTSGLEKGAVLLLGLVIMATLIIRALASRRDQPIPGEGRGTVCAAIVLAATLAATGAISEDKGPSLIRLAILAWGAGMAAWLGLRLISPARRSAVCSTLSKVAWGIAILYGLYSAYSLYVMGSLLTASMPWDLKGRILSDLPWWLPAIWMTAFALPMCALQLSRLAQLFHKLSNSPQHPTGNRLAMLIACAVSLAIMAKAAVFLTDRDFRPEVTRLLRLESDGIPCMLDFQSGDLLMPDGPLPAADVVLRDNNLHFLGQGNIRTTWTDPSPKGYSDWTVADVVRPEIGSGWTNSVAIRGTEPIAAPFHSSDGATGVLEVKGNWLENGKVRGVTVRYRLVPTATGPLASMRTAWMLRRQ